MFHCFIIISLGRHLDITCSYDINVVL